MRFVLQLEPFPYADKHRILADVEFLVAGLQRPYKKLDSQDPYLFLNLKQIYFRTGFSFVVVPLIFFSD
jgi:hypothetical protein